MAKNMDRKAELSFSLTYVCNLRMDLCSLACYGMPKFLTRAYVHICNMYLDKTK
jgi:hypothetical protein